MAKSLVVDKNVLEDPSLEEFLGRDSANRAVLTDFVAFESFAGSSALNLIRSVKILSKFPRQVLVLKSSLELAQLGPIDPNIRFGMVDWRRTKSFPAFCADVRKVERDDEKAKAHFTQQAKKAKRHLDILLDQNDAIVNLIVALRNDTGDDLLKARRAGKPLPGPEGARLLTSIEYMANRFFRGVPGVPPVPDDPLSASRCYIFRTAIAIRLLALKWAEHGGGVENARREKVRNDFVDSTYAVAATYWDGFLTSDKKAYDIYFETEFLANDFFPRVRMH